MIVTATLLLCMPVTAECATFTAPDLYNWLQGKGGVLDSEPTRTPFVVHDEATDRIALVIARDLKSAHIITDVGRVAVTCDGGLGDMKPKGCFGFAGYEGACIAQPIDTGGAIPHMRLFLRRFHAEISASSEVTIRHDPLIPWSVGTKQWELHLWGTRGTPGSMQAIFDVRSLVLIRMQSLDTTVIKTIKVRHAAAKTVSDIRAFIGHPSIPTDLDAIGVQRIPTDRTGAGNPIIVFRSAGKLFIIRPSGSPIEMTVFDKDIVNSRLSKIVADSVAVPCESEKKWSIPLSAEDFDLLQSLCTHQRTPADGWFLHPRSYCVASTVESP